MARRLTHRCFNRRRAGLEVVEYSIILGLIVASAVTAIGLLGGWVTGAFDGLASLIGAE